MILRRSYKFPENCDLRMHFRALTGEAIKQASVDDKHIGAYISNLLVDFMSIENFYAIRDTDGGRLEYAPDLLKQAEASPRGQKLLHYQQIGDHMLFLLGMFPQSMNYGRHMRSHSHCTETGRRSYQAASQMAREAEDTVTFLKLAQNFDRCVNAVTWVHEYTTDWFFQYMHRQFGIGV